MMTGTLPSGSAGMTHFLMSFPSEKKLKVRRRDVSLKLLVVIAYRFFFYSFDAVEE